MVLLLDGALGGRSAGRIGHSGAACLDVPAWPFETCVVAPGFSVGLDVDSAGRLNICPALYDHGGSGHQSEMTFWWAARDYAEPFAGAAELLLRGPNCPATPHAANLQAPQSAVKIEAASLNLKQPPRIFDVQDITNYIARQAQ
jgi:hypothetical protein